jgi:hypothetical protein
LSSNFKKRYYVQSEQPELNRAWCNDVMTTVMLQYDDPLNQRSGLSAMKQHWLRIMCGARHNAS